MGRERNVNSTKRYIGCILLAAGFALLFISRISHSFAQWYSENIYPLWVGSIGRLSGLFPFSLSEVLLYLLILWFAVTGGVRAGRAVRKKEQKASLYSWLSTVFVIVSMLFFLYEINCGVNYHRESFAESSGIELREYSSAELKEVCLWLTEEIKDLSGMAERDQDGVMEAGRDAGEEAAAAMKSLGKTCEGLEGYYPRPKGLIVPWTLSVQNLTGVYSPFTVEANYNSGMTDYNIPFTMCHELSHLRGFMQEQEANFIAFLACRESENIQFRYSGNLTGWVYCMNVLRRTDYEAWEEVRPLLAPEAEADLAANREFWEKYDGAVAEVSNRVNDTYLKANGQADGVKSYNRMVDLIVAYYRYEGQKAF